MKIKFIDNNFVYVIRNIFWILLFISLVGHTYGQNYKGSVNFNTIDDQQITFNEVIEKSNVKPVILYTWLRVCEPCIARLDSLNSVYKDLNNQNFKFYSVNVDKFDLSNNSKSFFKLKTKLELLNYLEIKDWAFETIYNQDQSYFKKVLNNKESVPQLWVFDKGKVVQYEYGYGGPTELFDEFIIDIIKSFENPISNRTFFKTDSNGRHKLQQYSLNKGRSVGEWKLYYPNTEKKIQNQLEYIRNFNEIGQRNGEWIIFYKNGQIRLTGNYLRDKKNGVWKAFDENGELQALEKYYEDGIIKETGSYKNGERSGEWRNYYPNGKLKRIGNYINGNENGEFKYYYKNGNLEQKGNFNFAKTSGEWRGYYDNGKLQFIKYFKDGMEIRDRRKYYKNDSKLNN